MRVGINLFDFWSPGSRGEGVLNYVRGLVEGLAQVDHENEYVLFLNSLNHDEFSHLPARFKGIVATLDPRKRRNRVLWEQVLLPLSFKKYGLDLIHFPGGTASLMLLRKGVVTYHAANVAYYAKHFRAHTIGIKQFYVGAMEKAVTPRAARIITDSQFSKHDMVQQLGIREAKIDVVYLTVPNGGKNGNGNGAGTLSYPYILNVSSSAIHKNLNGLISAYALLKRRLPSAPKLVIAGAVPDKPAWGMHQRSDLEQQARLGVGEEVVSVPYPPRDRLIALFRGAKLFVFPSLFEGFGLAPLEAMQYGIPVVLSDQRRCRR